MTAANDNDSPGDQACDEFLLSYYRQILADDRVPEPLIQMCLNAIPVGRTDPAS